MKANGALKDYLDRIGAEQLNFRTWMVKLYKGHYYHERALIKVGTDGTIKVNRKDYAPTDEEAALIKKNWDDSEFPKSITARDTRGIKLNTVGSVLYEFYNDDGKLIFCQERTDPKGFIPWSMWSDGKWRMMEPDGPLPFWKPKKRPKKDSGLLMIHEGCKSAKAANELPKDHPWYEEFKDYEHWGILGGALAVHRADYADLKKAKPTECIYVCDNDYSGKSALQVVSEHYGSKITGVMFDPRFKGGWDIADPLPEEFFEDKRYVGPDFSTFKLPATFATELVPQEKGKPLMVVRKPFLEEWTHSIVPEVFIHREWPDRIYGKNEFNNLMAPFSHSQETSRLVIKEQAGKGCVLRYDPSNDAGSYASSEGHYINTHQPCLIKAEAGDLKPFLDFMDHLIPEEEDRKEAMRWVATLIARPDIKMHYGMLLISETQGVGKGTLGEKILAPLVGEGNVSYPGEEEIVDSKYNYWTAHKRLAVVHEIYAGHSSKAYNKLKSVITDKFIEVHKKYQADYKIDNWIHILACSNSLRAIKLSMDDRRWLVPKVREDKRDVNYWTEFNYWLERKGGLKFIKHWAGEFKDYVRSGAAAPWTSIKREVVEDSMSTGQLLVHDTLAAIRSEMNGDHVLIADVDLVSLISDIVYEGRGSDRLERPVTVRAVAKGGGWHINGKRAKVKEWGTLLTRPRIICSHSEDAEVDPVDLAKAGRKLFNVTEFYNKHRRI